MNVEADQAGKLRAFREKFGRGWDASRGERQDDEEKGLVKGQGDVDSTSAEGKDDGGYRSGEDNLMDLISGYGQEAEGRGDAAGVREEKGKSGKRKGGQR